MDFNYLHSLRQAQTDKTLSHTAAPSASPWRPMESVEVCWQAFEIL